MADPIRLTPDRAVQECRDAYLRLEARIAEVARRINHGDHTAKDVRQLTDWCDRQALLYSDMARVDAGAAAEMSSDGDRLRRRLDNEADAAA